MPISLSTLNINDVSQAIQLALGPAFLLTGIAGMLNVMAGRLARIIDRGRRLTEGRDGAALTPTVAMELQALDRRRHLASAAITGCTFAALLVCLVIATLFLEAMLRAPLKWLVGTLFTGATVALVIGLGFFLREVHLATTTIRIPSMLPRETPEPQSAPEPPRASLPASAPSAAPGLPPPSSAQS